MAAIPLHLLMLMLEVLSYWACHMSEVIRADVEVTALNTALHFPVLSANRLACSSPWLAVDEYYP